MKQKQNLSTNADSSLPTRKPKKHLKRKTSEIIFVCCMLLLPIIQFAVFWVVPNIGSITMAFQKNATSTSFSMYQFETFWKDLTTNTPDHVRLISSITNSLIYFAINIFICTPLVLFFSYILFRKVPFAGVFKVVFYLPSILGLTVTATLFLFLFLPPSYTGASGGPMWELLVKNGLFGDPQAILEEGGVFQYSKTAFVMVIAYSIWTCVGLNMIMFHGAMKRIPTEIFESADMDGVGFMKQFFSIVLPLIWPTISTLVIFSLSGIFVTYGAVMILTPKVPEASMIGWFITQKTTESNLGNYAAAVGLVFTIIGLPFILLIKKGLDKIGAQVEY